ncbi:metal ABC transporter solute-binding protein, Zn/Mn family [Bacillus sp. S/N-304-OC-R1]|uniref:metal ABC transporter solute-binding protein, Zn/Mn family n=1 Tax=Bacillus sp. S/N-304-OC-R1 TaxID=2758034 RepID=UPI001C8E5283|nr:zinc ABC transporter substrate-binding protein [Bacillus sp. S/N-304-OC-R1]MBY0122858.1 zinc ABC transporter substrate-binding protein [Bacillus sp. S/N-304-OC-R1]
MKKLLTFLLLFSLILSGCAKGEKEEKNKENDKLTVYTTVYPLQYFSERIGGQYIEAKTIYPPGANEHTFEPTQKDMMKLADADLFFYIGLGLEGFVDKSKETLKNEQVQLIAAGENIHFDPELEKKPALVDDHHDHDANHEEEDVDHDATHEGEDHDHDATHEGEDHDHDATHEGEDHDHGDIDPHVWIDPIYAKDLAESIKDALIEKMPEHKDEFTSNYDNLIIELDQLNEDFNKVLNQSKHKEIIVSHAAYGYWEKRYDIKQISVSGMQNSSEPTQKQLENIIKVAKEHHLKYVFFEQNISSKLTEIIQKELGAEQLHLHNLSVLTDNDIKNNSNYFSIMKANLEALQKALN